MKQNIYGILLYIVCLSFIGCSSMDLDESSEALGIPKCVSTQKIPEDLCGQWYRVGSGETVDIASNGFMTFQYGRNIIVDFEERVTYTYYYANVSEGTVDYWDKDLFLCTEDRSYSYYSYYSNDYFLLSRDKNMTEEQFVDEIFNSSNIPEELCGNWITEDCKYSLEISSDGVLVLSNNDYSSSSTTTNIAVAGSALLSKAKLEFASNSSNMTIGGYHFEVKDGNILTIGNKTFIRSMVPENMVGTWISSDNNTIYNLQSDGRIVCFKGYNSYGDYNVPSAICTVYNDSLRSKFITDKCSVAGGTLTIGDKTFSKNVVPEEYCGTWYLMDDWYRMPGTLHVAKSDSMLLNSDGVIYCDKTIAGCVDYKNNEMWAASITIVYLTKDFLVGYYSSYSDTRCIVYNRNASDNTPPPSDDPAIIGEWVNGSNTYVYNADGTFLYNNETGKYFTSNNVCFRLYDNGSLSIYEYNIEDGQLKIGNSTYTKKQ